MMMCPVCWNLCPKENERLGEDRKMGREEGRREEKG